MSEEARVREAIRSWVLSTSGRIAPAALGDDTPIFSKAMLESVHVIGLALVFGSIAVIDLRLLGVASAHRSFARMASDTMKWTWAAFALTALTGALMFITNATVYFNNVYFRAKLLLLLPDERGALLRVLRLAEVRRACGAHTLLVVGKRVHPRLLLLERAARDGSRVSGRDYRRQ